MRAMPHRVASPTAVTFAEPRLAVAGQFFGPTEPIVPWDYLSESTVMSSVSVDEAEFLKSTGLSTLSGVTAQVQVDCRTTGSRHIARIPLTQGGHAVNMEVRLGSHQVADQIEVTQSVVLDTPDGPTPPSWTKPWGPT